MQADTHNLFIHSVFLCSFLRTAERPEETSVAADINLRTFSSSLNHPEAQFRDVFPFFHFSTLLFLFYSDLPEITSEKETQPFFDNVHTQFSTPIWLKALV